MTMNRFENSEEKVRFENGAATFIFFKSTCVISFDFMPRFFFSLIRYVFYQSESIDDRHFASLYCDYNL